MRKPFLIISTICLLLAEVADAQSLTNRQRRYINTKVLNVIEEYERFVTVYDDEAQYMFQSLFVDGAQIFCDMIGFPSYLSKISVADYVNLVSTASTSTTIVIKDVKKGEMTYSGGVWNIPITFSKSVSYIDNNGYAFSTEEYYGKDFDITMSLIYDPDSDQCRIESVDGAIASNTKFPEGRFFIVEKETVDNSSSKTKKFFDELDVNGSPITYNIYGQAVMPSGRPEVNDIDVVVNIDTLKTGLNYDVVNFDFKRRSNRLKVRYGIAPFGAYNVTTSQEVLHKSDAMEAGLDFGTTWRAGKSAKMGFFFGAGVSMSNIGLSLGSPVKYSYKTSLLDETSNLFRNYTVAMELSSLSEKLSFMDLVVPVYFEVEHRAGKHVLISWNFGVKAYYNLKTSFTPYSVTGNMKISDDVSSSSTNVDFAETFDTFLSPVSYKRNQFEVSAAANLGIDVNLFKRILYLSVKGGYEYGLTNSYYAAGRKLYDKSALVYPVVYDVLGEKFYAMHSAVSNTSYHRQAIWLQFGLKIKM